MLSDWHNPSDAVGTYTCWHLPSSIAMGTYSCPVEV